MNPVVQGVLGGSVIIWTLGSSFFLWGGWKLPHLRPRGWPWLGLVWPIMLVIEWWMSNTEKRS